MTLMTGSHAILEMLTAERVEYIFGNPGTSESPIMDALEDYPSLKYLLVMQEGVAVGMADAYARATGQPSFLNLHIETGLANSISLLHNASEGGTPMVLSAGNKDIRELAHGRTKLAEMVGLFTKWSAEVTHADQIPYVMRRAFNEAKSPPTGPTFVGFSANALDSELDVDISPSQTGYFNIRPDNSAIEEATRILASASSPIMIVSDRVGESNATNEAIRVAELLGAKVYASIYSSMNFPTSHPQFAGRVRLGFPETSNLLDEADVILMVGKLMTDNYMFSAPQLRFFNPHSKLIHLDISASEIGKTQPTEVGIISDPKAGLNKLTESLEACLSRSEKNIAKKRLKSLTLAKSKNAKAWQHQICERWNHVPMSAERMMAEIKTAMPHNVLIVDDAVSSRDALYKTMEFDEPGSLLGGRGGALGWGMGGAMGMKLANPERPVIAIVGDGSAMMTVQALWTAAVENIPVVYIICNNGAYRVLKLNMNLYKRQILREKLPISQYIGMDFAHPLDISAMAQAMGVYSQRIEIPSDLGPSLQKALDMGKPVVLDVIIDGSL